jgi:hypothetical protein
LITGKEICMKSMIGLCAAVALSAAGALVAPVTYAQQKSSDTPPAVSPANIPDHKIDAVAAAAKRVAVIGDSYEQKLAKAAGDGEKEKIVDEANRAITKAVNAQGLTVDEYVSIMKVAQNDPAVRDKIVQRLK